ncbi:hypothetical protein KM043_007081 [Ampulex compressa]|nr:hypothetical protein KM043_007081 [Ampulex compressa]
MVPLHHEGMAGTCYPPTSHPICFCFPVRRALERQEERKRWFVNIHYVCVEKGETGEKRRKRNGGERERREHVEIAEPEAQRYLLLHSDEAVGLQSVCGHNEAVDMMDEEKGGTTMAPEGRARGGGEAIVQHDTRDAIAIGPAHPVCHQHASPPQTHSGHPLHA